MNLPIPVRQFEKYIPHRPPMVWVDDLLSAEADSGQCRVNLRKDALYMKDGKIRRLAYVEWLAQAFAFVRSGYWVSIQKENIAKVEQAFLVGVRKAEILVADDDAEVLNAKSLLMSVHSFREFGPITIFSGEITLESGRVLARGSLHVYQK